MSDVQEIRFRSPILPPKTIGGSVGDPFGITSDMPHGYYSNAGGDVYIPVLRGATGTYAMQSAPAETVIVAVTVDTSEPVIPGTTIPLYRISALLDGGLTVAQVKEDFPSLTIAQIVSARDHASKHPNYGKQYPRESLKRLLRDSGFRKVEKELKRTAKRS
jgi:uncharacterized protein (DUF433 family)